MTEHTFDYVIVGGGTAGAVGAARFSEDPRVSVALVEWGPSDRGEPRARQGTPLVRDAGGRVRPGLPQRAPAARMGSAADPGAVLDPHLRVRGVTGLRVADTSAFPSLTTVNPMVAVLMLAERAVGLIAGAR